MARRARRSADSLEVVTDTDALYGLPLADFTAARDRMAQALRGAGEKREAARIKGLRKPGTAAWAVNQLARREPAQVKALLHAGERLRDVQRAMRTKGAGALREASETLRGHVAALLRVAEDILAEGGFAASGKHLDGVRQILQSTASASASEQALLRRGVLTEVFEAVDFSDVLGMLGGEDSGAEEDEGSEEDEDDAESEEEEERGEASSGEKRRAASADTGRAGKKADAKKASGRKAEAKEAGEKKASAKKSGAKKSSAKTSDARAAKRAKLAAARDAARAKQAAKVEARARREAERVERAEQVAARRVRAARRREAQVREKEAERAQGRAIAARELAEQAQARARAAGARADAAERAAKQARAQADAAGRRATSAR